MKYLLLSLALVGCSSLSNKYNDVEKVISIGQVDVNLSGYGGYLKYVTNKAPHGYYNGMTKPQDIKEDMLKALSWSKQLKNDKADLDKEIDSYLNSSLYTSYIKRNNKEFFKICFTNLKYKRIDDIKCGFTSINNIPRFIKKLSSKNITNLQTIMDSRAKMRESLN